MMQIKSPLNLDPKRAISGNLNKLQIMLRPLGDLIRNLKKAVQNLIQLHI
jgi:hypothetical protein